MTFRVSVIPYWPEKSRCQSQQCQPCQAAQIPCLLGTGCTYALGEIYADCHALVQHARGPKQHRLAIRHFALLSDWRIYTRKLSSFAFVTCGIFIDTSSSNSQPRFCTSIHCGNPEYDNLCVYYEYIACAVHGRRGKICSDPQFITDVRTPLRVGLPFCHCAVQRCKLVCTRKAECEMLPCLGMSALLLPHT